MCNFSLSLVSFKNHARFSSVGGTREGFENGIEWYILCVIMHFTRLEKGVLLSV